jgi:hypothetical protein
MGWLEWTPESPTSAETRGHDFESMEYNPPNSAAYRSWLRQQPFGRAWDKWLVMALIGTLVGTTSFALNKTIDSLFAWRGLLGRYFLDWDVVGGYMLAWFFYVLLSALAALGASLLVVKVAPAATASGVPAIMAFLNGVYVPKVCAPHSDVSPALTTFTGLAEHRQIRFICLTVQRCPCHVAPLFLMQLVPSAHRKVLCRC